MNNHAWGLLLNTAILVGAVCAISVPAGSLLAWLLVRTDLPERRVIWQPVFLSFLQV